MSKAPYFKCYPSDFLNGVADLSPHEGWVYTVVLMLMYDADGTCPDDAKRIAKRCNMRPSRCRKIIESLIVTHRKFTRENGQIVHERVVKEVSTRNQKSLKCASSANQRWQKESEKTNENNKSTDANASVSDMPNQKPESRVQKLDSKKKTSLPSEVNEKKKSAVVIPLPVRKPVAVVEPQLPDELTIAVALWNNLAAEHGLSKCRKLTAERKKKLTHQIDGFGLSGWDEALNNIPKSSFLLGGNDRGWKCNLDFLLQESKFIKVLEGSYDDGGGNGGSPEGRRAAAVIERLKGGS